MTDTNNTEQKFADDLQPLIDGIIVVAPAEQVDGAKAFFKRYLKGWIALAGIAGSYVLTLAPIDSTVAHVSTAVVGVVTVIGLVAARNGL